MVSVCRLVLGGQVKDLDVKVLKVAKKPIQEGGKEMYSAQVADATGQVTLVYRKSAHQRILNLIYCF